MNNYHQNNNCGLNTNQFVDPLAGYSKYVLFILTVLLIILSEIISGSSITSTVYAATYISGRIPSDTIWPKEGSPYIVTGPVYVYGNTTTASTLTIEPGVEVRFNLNMPLYIGNHDGSKGALVAVGTEEEPIVFTANTSTPTRGYWSKIYFYNSTIDSSTVMEHCVVEYAGYSNGVSIYLNSASPAIRNCQIRQGGGHGIYCGLNSSPTIANNTISNNGSYPKHQLHL